MHPRVLAAFACALCAWLVSGRASAWQEAHEIGDDLELEVEPSGLATVRHEIRWHVVHGPLKSFDLTNVDGSAVVEPLVNVDSDDGRSLAAHVSSQDARTARVVVDDPRATQHGTFTFDVRWRIDLVAAGALVRDGATWRLSISQPVAVEGLNGAQTIIDLPAAPDPPQPLDPETGAVDDGALATLRRGVDRDVLKLLRPHVARGESVKWVVRVDDRALSGVAALHPPPPVDPRVSSEPDRIRGASLAASIGVVGLAYAWLVRRKSGAKGADPGGGEANLERPVLPLPLGLRSTLSGASLALGIVLQVSDEVGGGGVCVAIAIVAAAIRPKAPRATARGPGRWFVLRPCDAFAARARPSDWLDLGSPSGRITALLVGAAVTVLILVLRNIWADAPWLVGMDALVFVPLWMSPGSRAGCPYGGRGAARWLARSYRRLSRVDRLRVAPWARVAQDGSIDELRLLVLPRLAVPGLVGIEMGLAWSSTPVGGVGLPEVLVRFLHSSDASSRLTEALPRERSLPGRRPEERVVRLLPRWPTCDASVVLAGELAGVLTDRRAAPFVSCSGRERRTARLASPGPSLC